MGKKIIFTALFALTTILAQAQQIKVEYENKISSLPELIQQYFEMQKVQHSRLMIKGNFNGKRAKIGKVICDKGSFIEREMLADYVHFILVDSIETLDFMAIPYGKDSIRISCFILLETFTSGDGPDIPIIAYSMGIPIKDGTWYCGLRDSGVEPRKWHEKYGIDGYIFYTIRLEEDTPPDNKMPIYIKIAKQDAHAIHQQ